MDTDYQALVVRKGGDRTFSFAVETRSLADLPPGDVLIRVHYSSINFKDCMSAQGNPAITRRFPHTPGIDAAGIVAASSADDIREGDRVMVISHAMGMSIPGGFGQYVRVPAAWVMPVPDVLSLEEAMAFGTPGYTAALSIEALLDAGIALNGADAVVSGATGGVGCMAVAMLALLGCRVTAVSGKAGAGDFLGRIGAAETAQRTEIEDNTGRNMLLPRWDAAIDVAGGNLLASLIKMMHPNGAVAATGMVQGTTFPVSILPFILRGVRLLGVNAENTDTVRRRAVWHKMATAWKPATLPAMYRVVGLDDLPAAIAMVAEGRQIGRVVANLSRSS